jgi:Trypsin-like peptidase domain
MKRIIVTLLLSSSLLGFIPRALADLDDTIAESAIKYGPPTATGSSQILVYTHSPYRIWQTYDNTGHCAIAEFSPLDHATPFTAHDLAELDCDNLPDAMIPGIGPNWERVPWSGNARGRNRVSFQYSGEGGIRYQVISGQSRDDDNDVWYDDRLYLNAAGIEMFKAFGNGARGTAVELATPAKDAGAPKASPVYKTYTLRTGQVVQMSPSQWAINKGQWHALEPEDIAEKAARITVTIEVDKNDGSHMFGTGFFINNSEVITAWHVVRDAGNITVVDQDGSRCNAQLSISKPSIDLATITVPGVYSRVWAAFVTDSDWERIGERVFVYGNPEELTGTFSDGMLSSVRSSGAILQITAPIDHGSSGSPVFNQYGLVIGIVSRGIGSGGLLNFAISSNSILEALSLKTDDHPNGFYLGITQGVELRDSGERDADIALENAARIEAENKAKAAAGPTEAEKLKAQHDEQVRADNERALKAARAAAPTPSQQ